MLEWVQEAKRIPWIRSRDVSCGRSVCLVSPKEQCPVSTSSTSRTTKSESEGGRASTLKGVISMAGLALAPNLDKGFLFLNCPPLFSCWVMTRTLSLSRIRIQPRKAMPLSKIEVQVFRGLIFRDEQVKCHLFIKRSSLAHHGHRRIDSKSGHKPRLPSKRDLRRSKFEEIVLRGLCMTKWQSKSVSDGVSAALRVNAKKSQRF